MTASPLNVGHRQDQKQGDHTSCTGQSRRAHLETEDESPRETAGSKRHRRISVWRPAEPLISQNLPDTVE